MKYALLSAVFAAILAGPARADDGQIGPEQLAEMGLSGLTVISDAEGEAVRGEGFVIASSTSFVLLTVGLFTAGDLSTILAGDIDGINNPPVQTQAAANLEIQSVVPPLDIRITGSSSGFAAGGTLAAPAAP